MFVFFKSSIQVPGNWNFPNGWDPLSKQVGSTVLYMKGDSRQIVNPRKH